MQHPRLTMYVTFEDQVARILHKNNPGVVIDVSYGKLEVEGGHIIQPFEWESQLCRVAAGALSEYIKRGGLMSLDDPYQPTTPEQQEKLKLWFDKLFGDKDGSSGTP